MISRSDETRPLPPPPRARSRYELCPPVSPRLWGLKTLAAIVACLILEDDPGYYGGLRFRIRDKVTGAYIYEVTASALGIDAQATRASITRDLERLSVDEFDWEYRVGR